MTKMDNEWNIIKVMKDINKNYRQIIQSHQNVISVLSNSPQHITLITFLRIIKQICKKDQIVIVRRIMESQSLIVHFASHLLRRLLMYVIYRKYVIVITTI